MLTIIIPCFNESERIVSTLDGISVFMKRNKGFIDEVIVVDDGSIDRTQEEVLLMSRKLPVRCIRYEKNRGKWFAIRTGIAACRTDAFLLLDADESASVWEIENHMDVVKRALENKMAVFGSRFLPGAIVFGKGFIRRFVSWNYRALVRGALRFATGDVHADDPQCPWKIAYKSTMLDMLSAERFAGDAEFCCVVQSRIMNIPVVFNHREKGSKIRFGAGIDAFLELRRITMRFHAFRTRGLDVYDRVQQSL